MRHVLLAVIAVYQRCFTRFTPAICRFSPTCSEYARLAIVKHGAVRGAWFAVKRIARCHPWHPGGLDPVP